MYTVKKVGDKLIYEKLEKNQALRESSNLTNMNVSIEKEHPNSKLNVTPKYNFCPECKTPFSSDFRKGDICPFCGHKL